MFLFRRRDVNSARFRALRELYRSFTEQNGPDARSRHLLRDWLSPVQRAQFDANTISESRVLTPAGDIEFNMVPRAMV
jgi:hypothetical protein